MFKMSRFQALAASTVILAAPQLASAETRDYALSDFNRVEVTAGINAIVEIGGEFSVRAETDDPKLLEDLKIEVRGRKLMAGLDLGFFASLIGKNADVTVYITLPDLTEAESTAGADMMITGDFGDSFFGEVSSGASMLIEGLTANSVSLEASSGGSMLVSGNCGILRADASSGGSVRADALECLDVSAEASSGGGAKVFATRSIEADASSGGTVDISGGPDQIDVDESTGGDVRFKN